MKTIFLFIIFIFFPSSVYANSFKAEFPQPIVKLWEDRQNYVSEQDLQGAYGTLVVIKELKKHLNIKNMNLLSQVLLWEAVEWNRKGNNRERDILLTFSRDLSPDYPPVYYYQARIGWAEKPFQIFDNIGITVTFIKVYVKNFWYLMNGLKTLWVTLLGTVFLSLFLLLGILVIRSFPILGHQLWEWSGRKMNRWNQWGLVGVFALLPVFLGLKPFWILFVWASLTWFWLNRSERVVLVTLFFLFFGMMYTASQWGAFFSGKEHKELDIMVDAVHGEWIASDQLAGFSQDESDWPILFTLGLALKREGNCREAIGIYERIKNEVSGSKRALVENNIGNCYFHLKNYSEAKKIYEKNIQEFPSLVLPYYNLSQTYREQLLFEEGKKFYQKALEKNESLVAELSSISQASPEFIVVDANYGQKEVWKRLFSAKNEPLGDTLWAGFTGEIPKGIFVLLFSFWAASILFISWKESEQNGDLRCQTCSNPMCIKCQHFFFDLIVCENCWESLKIKKVKPILSAGRAGIRKGFSPFLGGISYILPGTGHLFYAKSIRGSLWILGWSFWVSLFILNGYGLFHVGDGISGILPPGKIVLLGLGLACFYLFFHFDLKRGFQN